MKMGAGFCFFSFVWNFGVLFIQKISDFEREREGGGAMREKVRRRDVEPATGNRPCHYYHFQPLYF